MNSDALVAICVPRFGLQFLFEFTEFFSPANEPLTVNLQESLKQTETIK